MKLSEHETETLLRESLERRATRAPDGHEVRNALARAGQRRPRARFALVGVTAAVVAIVAGVAIGTQVLTSSEEPAPTPEAAAAGLVLGYTPGWLPDGFTEQYRETGPGTTPQIRRWFGGTGEVALSAYSTADPEWSQTALRIAAIPDQTLVHGRVGMVTGATGTSALLTWLADDRHVLTAQVTGVPDARAVAQRIAESVTAKAVAIHGELRFGPLPAFLRLLSTAAYGTSPGDGASELHAYDPVRPAVAVLHASVSASAPTIGAAPIRVRGRDGFFLAGDDAVVTVQLPSGRWLTVTGKQPRETLIEIADAMQVDPAPDYRWIGRKDS